MAKHHTKYGRKKRGSKLRGKHAKCSMQADTPTPSGSVETVHEKVKICTPTLLTNVGVVTLKSIHIRLYT